MDDFNSTRPFPAEAVDPTTGNRERVTIVSKTWTPSSGEVLRDAAGRRYKKRSAGFGIELLPDDVTDTEPLQAAPVSAGDPPGDVIFDGPHAFLRDGDWM